MKNLLFTLCLIQIQGTAYGQEFVDLLGAKYSTTIEVLKAGGYEVNRSENFKESDGQNIKFITFQIESETSFSKEVKFLFLSDVCIAQLHILHFNRVAELVKQLDEKLIKDRKEYTWFESNKYLNTSYELKKIPPDHVLSIWLDLANALWE